jgi:hypothetical protein
MKLYKKYSYEHSVIRKAFKTNVISRFFGLDNFEPKLHVKFTAARSFMT